MGVSGVRISLDKFGEIMASLRLDVDKALAPSATQAVSSLGVSAAFGTRSLSGELQAAVQATTDAIALFADNVNVHIGNADGLLEAAHKTLSNYHAADLESARFVATTAPAAQDESTTANSDEGLSAAFIGPLPPLQAPIQIPPAGFCTAWDAYDVPRIWSSVNGDAAGEAWQQLDSLRRLGSTLEVHYRRLIALRQPLADAWSPTPGGAAEAFLATFDQHAAAIGQDAMCATTTAKALNEILTVISTTRGKIAKLSENWNSVTHDFWPEWWDGAAAETNDKARKVMMEADVAIADHRKSVLVPNGAAPLVFKQGTEIGGGTTTSSTETRHQSTSDTSRPASPRATTPIPPLPGINPVDSSGPVLSGGLPVPVGVTPSTPPSVLPIPPGVSPLAPNGGLYVLPGPWARAGNILQMPVPPSVTRTATSPFGGPRPTATTGGAGGSTPMMTAAGGGPAGQSSRRGKRQRMGSEEWEVAEGVPPVIGDPPPPLPPDDEGQETPTSELEDEFQRWFGRIAEPWEGTKNE